MIFDRNASSNGTDVTHTVNTPQVVINRTGIYEISFHGTVGPTGSSKLPVTIILSLQQQGTTVPGATVQHTFHTSSDSGSLAFSQIIQVTTVPSTLQVTSLGGNFFYGGITMTVQRLGDISADSV